MNKITRELTGKRPTVLACATHERYQSMAFGNVDCDFILWDYKGCKQWNEKFAPLPDNHTIRKHITPDLQFDAVLSQHKFGQIQQFKPIAQHLGIPLIQLEHIAPRPDISNKLIRQLFEMNGDINIFISDWSARAWGWGDNSKRVILEHGLDIDLFKPANKKHNKPLSVVNQFDTRDVECGFNLWLSIIGESKYVLVGDTPNWSKPAKDVNELVRHYQDAQIFLNTSTSSPIPMSVLEAMACGCCVVSTSTCAIPSVIENGENGFLYPADRPDIAKDILKKLKNNPQICKKVGDNARRTIEERFSKDRFTKDWQHIFSEATK